MGLSFAFGNRAQIQLEVLEVFVLRSHFFYPLIPIVELGMSNTYIIRYGSADIPGKKHKNANV